MEIVRREVALNGLERARAYIAQDNPAAAERVRERILAPFEISLTCRTWGGPAGSRTPASWSSPERPTFYIVAYTVLEDVVVIIAVQHGAQEWPERF